MRGSSEHNKDKQLRIKLSVYSKQGERKVNDIVLKKKNQRGFV